MITKEQFTEMALIAVQARYPQFSFERNDVLSLQTASPDGESVFLISLDSIYPHTLEMSFENCLDIVYQRIDVLLMVNTTEIDLDEAQDRIYPHLGRYGHPRNDSAGRIVVEFHAGIQIGLVVDSPQYMRFLSIHHLKNQDEWLIKSLFDLAFVNLDRLTSQTELIHEQFDGHHVWAYLGLDGYAADRLLSTDFWSRLVEQQGFDRAYLAIPHRDAIYCATNPDFLAPFVNEREVSGYPLTQDIFVIKDGHIIETGRIMTEEQYQEHMKQSGGLVLSA